MLRRRLRLRSLTGLPRTIGTVEELAEIAGDLGPRLGPGDVVALEGPLGVGKTTFAQALGAALGVEERMTSPTYVLAHRYPAPVPVVHLDLYRLDGAAERDIDDVVAEIDPTAIALVEWPGMARGRLPAPTWIVRLEFAGAGGRTVRVEAVP